MAHTNQLRQHLCLPLILFILASSQALCRQLDDEKLVMLKRHEHWMARFGRIYKDAEEKHMRHIIFKENVKFIEAFNKKNDQKYTLNINEFADLTNEEFRATCTGYKKKQDSSKVMMSNSMKVTTSFRYGNVTDVPPSLDWREKGAVTPIKNQEECGSCWAFAAVAAVEGVNQIKTGNLIPLSEQELVDCDTAGSSGCKEGFVHSAFEFVKRNKGLSTEANYPYQGVDGSCKTQKTAFQVVSISGYEKVPANHEKALLQAVANQPVSVDIDSSSYEFQFYWSGVFTGPCGSTIPLDHSVTIVGYGTSSDGTKYWLAKNSWGTRWGESGYIRMQRDIPAKEGLCGIAMEAYYPVVESDYPVEPPMQPYYRVKPPVEPYDLVEPPVQPSHPVKPPVKPYDLVEPPMQPYHPVKPPVEPYDLVESPVEPYFPMASKKDSHIIGSLPCIVLVLYISSHILL